MKSSRGPTQKEQGNEDGIPNATRPRMKGYGIPEDKKGLLPWSHINDRMSEALHYWVSTTGPDGKPYATPVDGLWLDGKLYFGGHPTTRRNRNLTMNTAVCIHLESATDVVIIQGEALVITEEDHSLASRLIEESKRKYGYGPRPEDIWSGGTFVFKPDKVLAWKQFPKDATRWDFSDV